MGEKGKSDMKRAVYPFERMSAGPKEQGWKMFLCRFCGTSEYAHPNSGAFADQICDTCGIRGIQGTAVTRCEKHGEYLAYRGRNGATLGSCPDCFAKQNDRPRGVLAKLFGRR